ncbi:hypothetical protein Ancab_035550 [Ancistrocladus abbreviatus]
MTLAVSLARGSSLNFGAHSFVIKEKQVAGKMLQVNFDGTAGGSFRRESLSVKTKYGRGCQGHDVEVINGKRVNVISIDETAYMGLRKKHLAHEDDEEFLEGCMLGKFLKGKSIYRQSFIIRSYEIGPDNTATMETLMNLLQEMAICHVTNAGLTTGKGFGETRAMSLMKLIWVITRVHVQVSKYSSWGDIVEVDTWIYPFGKNSIGRDWIIRDCRTQQIITKATSTWVVMNRETRRLSKLPEEVKNEVAPFYNTAQVAFQSGEEDTEKIGMLIDETADIIQSGLAPRWSDMDANQHVNNVKYIGWILESVPRNVLEEFNLTNITLEYRRECRQADVLESLTGMMKPSNSMAKSPRGADIESTHLLRMQYGKAEIVRARTEWKSK